MNRLIFLSFNTYLEQLLRTFEVLVMFVLFMTNLIRNLGATSCKVALSGNRDVCFC